MSSVDMENFVKRESRCGSVSYLFAPVRKPPACILRDWEDSPSFTHGKFKSVAWHAAYLLLRLVTPDNARLLHHEPFG